MTTELDLHGILHEDVPELVHRFINANWRPNVELRIVTGQSVRMQALVRKILGQYDLELIFTDMKNPGQIKIHTWQE